jgi:tetratricopeptide (TPR) repeat protein
MLLALVLASPRVSAAAGGSFREQLAQLEAQHRAQPTNTSVLFALGDLCHDEGVRDNREAVKLAEKYFRSLLELDPNHARAMALLGSTLTLKGRDAFWPTTQIDYVKQGNRAMDNAVRLAPEDAEVRFIRAINNFHMPKFLGREQIVQEDFAWLWKQLLQHPENTKLDRKQEIALHQGLTLKKLKRNAEAREVWEQGLTWAPESTWATRLREELRKLSK